MFTGLCAYTFASVEILWLRLRNFHDLILCDIYMYACRPPPYRPPCKLNPRPSSFIDEWCLPVGLKRPWGQSLAVGATILAHVTLALFSPCNAPLRMPLACWAPHVVTRAPLRHVFSYGSVCKDVSLYVSFRRSLSALLSIEARCFTSRISFMDQLA